MDVQYYQSPEGSPVLFAQLPSHHLDNVIYLSVVYLQVLLHGLRDSNGWCLTGRRAITTRRILASGNKHTSNRCAYAHVLDIPFTHEINN